MSKDKQSTLALSPGPRFKTQYTGRSPRHIEAERSSPLPSLTIPDQTMSISTILQRHSRGLPVDAYEKVPLWDMNASLDDDILPDPRHMDLADRQALREGATEEMQYLRNKHKRSKDEAKPTPPTEQEPKPQTPEKPPQNAESDKK